MLGSCFNTSVDIKHHNTSDTEAQPHRARLLILSLHMSNRTEHTDSGETSVPWPFCRTACHILAAFVLPTRKMAVIKISPHPHMLTLRNSSSASSWVKPILFLCIEVTRLCLSSLRSICRFREHKMSVQFISIMRAHLSRYIVFDSNQLGSRASFCLDG